MVNVQCNSFCHDTFMINTALVQSQFEYAQENILLILLMEKEHSCSVINDCQHMDNLSYHIKPEQVQHAC